MASEFAQLLSLLSLSQVEFILIGGLAAQAHGSARLTQDTDVIYRRTPENIHRLVQALSGMSPYLRGAPPGLPFKFDVATVLRGLNFTLTTAIGDLDLLGEMTGGGSYEQVLPHTLVLRVFDSDIRVLDLAALIRAKRRLGDPRILKPSLNLKPC